MKRDGIRARLEKWSEEVSKGMGSEFVRMRAAMSDSPDHTPTRSRRMHELSKLHQKKTRRYSFLGRPSQVPDSDAFDHLIKFVVAVIAAATLLVPLIALSYIRIRDYTIMATCLLVLVYAFIMPMIGNLTTTEVMVSVATYAAVLVVFVGQTIAPPSKD